MFKQVWVTTFCSVLCCLFFFLESRWKFDCYWEYRELHWSKWPSAEHQVPLRPNHDFLHHGLRYGLSQSAAFLYLPSPLDGVEWTKNRWQLIVLKDSVVVFVCAGMGWKITMLILSSLALVLGTVILILNVYSNRWVLRHAVCALE